MISTVARPISPVLADTPIASPSAKLWMPDRRGDRHAQPQRAPAAEIRLSHREGLGLLHRHRVGRPAGHRGQVGGAAHATLEHRQAGAAQREAAGQHQREADRLAERALACLIALDRLLGDVQRVLEHVGEQEGEHADREHRETDASTVAQHLQPAERQAEKDREARKASQQDGLCK